MPAELQGRSTTVHVSLLWLARQWQYVLRLINPDSLETLYNTLGRDEYKFIVPDTIENVRDAARDQQYRVRELG